MLASILEKLIRYWSILFCVGGSKKPKGGWIAMMEVGGSLRFWSLLQMFQPSIFPMLKSDIYLSTEMPLDYKVPKQLFSSLAMPYRTMNDVNIFARVCNVMDGNTQMTSCDAIMSDFYHTQTLLD